MYTRVLPLAFGAAISPTILASAVLVLASKQRAVARGALYALGTMVVLVAWTGLGLTLLARVHDHISPTQRAVSGAVDATIGLVLVVFGIREILLTPRPSRVHEEKEGLAAAFGLGLVMMLANFTSLILYLPAMKDIARSGDPTSDKIVVAVVALLITSLAATLPLALRIVAPGPAATLLADVNGFVTKHQRSIVVIVSFVFGAYLLTRGLHDL
jgi:threonine/homoserine/homoserine lactone efflux protein